MQVEYGHMLTNEEFEATQAYGQRALYTPIVIFGLGFLSIFFYLCGMLWRCCCECCRCLPDADDVQYDYKRTTNTVFFYIFVLFVLLFDQLVFVGNTEIDKGMTTLDGALGDIKTLTQTVVDDTSNLIIYGNNMEDDYDSLKTFVQSNCPAYSSGLDEAGTSISDFSSQMNSLNKAIKSMPSNIEKVQNYLSKYAMQYRQIGIYVIWALAIVCSILFFAAKIVESTVTMKISIGLGVFTYILYILLGIPWVLITSVGGDFCMSPTYNLVKSAPAGDLRNTLRYYTSCVGNSTINNYIDEGSAGIVSLNDTLNAFRTAVGPSSTCGSAPMLTDLFVGVRNVNDSINSVESTLDCPNIRAIYFDIVNVGFCDQLYTGVFYIWGSQLVTSFCLLVLLVIASITYQYFDVARVVPSTDDSDARESDGPKLEMVEMGTAHEPYNNNNNNSHPHHQKDYHNAQAYSSVGYFDNGLNQ
jgi:hypothetical protein